MSFITVGQSGSGTAAISETYVVGSQAAMLALSADRGDIAIRTDESKTYILAGNDPTVLANWEELLTPPNAVTSVNSQTGTVTLNTSHISENTNLYLTESRVRATVLTGFLSGAGAVGAGDTILQAFNKLDGNVATKGDVFGPASSTNLALARFDLTTGKLLKNSLYLLGDDGQMSVALSGVKTATNYGLDISNQSSGSTTSFTLDGAGTWGHHTFVGALQNAITAAGNGGYSAYVRNGNRNAAGSFIVDGGNSSNRSIGVFGAATASNSPESIIGGLFEVSTNVATYTSAIPTGYYSALIANNKNSTYDIFQARDNGSIVFNILDGGFMESTTSASTSASIHPLKITHTASATAGINTALIRSALTLGGGSGWLANFGSYLTIGGTSNTNAQTAIYGYYVDMTSGATAAPISINGGNGNYGVISSTRVAATATNSGNLAGYFAAENGNVNRGIVTYTGSNGGTTPSSTGLLSVVFGTATVMPTTYAAVYGRLHNTYSGTVIDGKPNANAVFLGDNGNTSADLLNLQNASTTAFKIEASGKIDTNQTSAATTPGSVVAKMPIYDTAGALVGYIPVYDAIT